MARAKLKVKSKSPGLLCKDCGKDCCAGKKDYYMVTHELWEKYGVGNGGLCVDCMEKRIGRKFTKSDILPCLLNLYNKYTRSILIYDTNNLTAEEVKMIADIKTQAGEFYYQNHMEYYYSKMQRMDENSKFEGWDEDTKKFLIRQRELATQGAQLSADGHVQQSKDVFKLRAEEQEDYMWKRNPEMLKKIRAQREQFLNKIGRARFPINPK